MFYLFIFTGQSLVVVHKMTMIDLTHKSPRPNSRLILISGLATSPAQPDLTGIPARFSVVPARFLGKHIKFWADT
jgi:hypothetical protein